MPQKDPPKQLQISAKTAPENGFTALVNCHVQASVLVSFFVSLAHQNSPKTILKPSQKPPKSFPKKSLQTHLPRLPKSPRTVQKRPKQWPETQRPNGGETDLKQQPEHQNNEEKQWANQSEKYQIIRSSNGRVTPFLETTKEVRPEGTLFTYLLSFYLFIFDK